MIMHEKVCMRAMLSRGNLSRLKKLMRKAKAGEPITVAAIGGSITAGALAQGEKNRYAYHVAEWWRARYGNSDKVTLINAGVGATGSAIGVHRLDDDLLSKKPDFVVVEYAVNDAATTKGVDLTETYEGIVRRCLEAGAAVLLLFLPRVMHDDVSLDQRRVGFHYQLPMISITNAIEPLVEAGEMQWSEYSPDAVHPNKEGHYFIGKIIGTFLDTVAEDSFSEEEQPLPVPLTAHTYAVTKILDNKRLTPAALGSFYAAKDTFPQFPNGWRSDSAGEPMVIELPPCRSVMLLFKKSVDVGCSKAVVEVTSKDVSEAVELDGVFPNGWGNYAFPTLVFRSPSPQAVKLTLRVVEGSFELLRVMTAE